MEHNHIIHIGGEAARPQFLDNFRRAFGWDLREQGFGFGASLVFIKDTYGQLAIELGGRVKKSDTVYITSIESLLSAAGGVSSITDKDFYGDAMAIRGLPFEIKADFLYSLLLDQCPSGFFCWLGQRHVAADEDCFQDLMQELEVGGISVKVELPLKL